jgi:hypothetical protein
MLQGQSNAALFWDGHEGGGPAAYQTSFGRFWGPLARLTGLPEAQIIFAADRFDPAAHSIAGGTATFGLPGGDGAWLNPDAPGARRADPASWGDGMHMRALRRYVRARRDDVPADRPWLLIRMHSEYDGTLASAEEQALYGAANREFVARWRAAFGRPAALLPLFLVPVPYAMRTREGALAAIRASWDAMIRDPAQNAHLALGSTLDAEDRGDGSHWTSAAADRVALRMAIRIARWLWERGYAANDLAWLPGLGPRITAARRVPGRANGLDLLIAHDAGNDLVVPDRPDLGQFVVRSGGHGGRQHAVRRITRWSPDTLRLELDAPLPRADDDSEPVLVDYGLWPSYSGPSAQVTDNWHLLPKPRLARQAGVERVPMILCRMPRPLAVT